jgi:NADPH:quinone reductase-like Zn-dependent oxidoreductase
VGLNFRDLLNVLGMYPGDPGLPGGDCAGIITALGAGESFLRPLQQKNMEGQVLPLITGRLVLLTGVASTTHEINNHSVTVTGRQGTYRIQYRSDLMAGIHRARAIWV